MLKNRLVELTSMTGRADRIGSQIKLPRNHPKMQQSFGQVENLIDKMTNNNSELVQLKQSYKKTAVPQKQKQLLHNITMLSNKNQQIMKKVERKIKQINEKQKQDFKNGNTSNTINVTRITQKASNAITQFKQFQQTFSKGVRENIRRQANILQGGQISEQQVQSIIANPDKSQDMLRAKLLNQPSVQLQNAVSDIIDKYRDILQLQKNMHECLEMMQELALLVALTGQQLDSIQNTISNAGDYMQNGEKKLGDAKKEHKSSKKKMCCIIMLLMAVLGVVLIPVLITQL